MYNRTLFFVINDINSLLLKFAILRCAVCNKEVQQTRQLDVCDITRRGQVINADVTLMSLIMCSSASPKALVYLLTYLVDSDRRMTKSLHVLPASFLLTDI